MKLVQAGISEYLFPKCTNISKKRQNLIISAENIDNGIRHDRNSEVSKIRFHLCSETLFVHASAYFEHLNFTDILFVCIFSIAFSKPKRNIKSEYKTFNYLCTPKKEERSKRNGFDRIIYICSGNVECCCMLLVCWKGMNEKLSAKQKLKQQQRKKKHKPTATIAIVPFSRRITHMKIDYNSLLTSSLIQWQSWQQHQCDVWFGWWCAAAVTVVDATRCHEHFHARIITF